MPTVSARHLRPVDVFAASAAVAAIIMALAGPAHATAPTGHPARPAAADAPTPLPQCTEAPGAPVVLFVTATTARLKWAPPTCPAAPIIGYDVVEAPTTPMGPSRVLARTSGRSRVTVTGLTPGASYPVYVVARYPAYGSSPASPQTIVTTEARPQA